MVFRLYLCFSLLFFSSCGEFNVSHNPGGPSSYHNLLKSHPFSPQEEAGLLKSWNALKLLDYKKYNTPEEIQEMVEARLTHNERHERALYRAYLPHKDLGEVRRKYKILRQVGFKDPESVPHPRILDAVIETYRDFGDLYIGESHLGVEYEADKIPWAGHWYPFAGDALYSHKTKVKGRDGEDKEVEDGEMNSTLAKLDRLIQKVKGVNPGIRAYHMKRSERLKGTSWNGLCDARSFASVAKMEPFGGITVRGIHFTRANLKGILTVAHSGFNPQKDIQVTQYGTTYSRTFETDGTYQDVNPLVVHKISEEVIGRKREALVLNEAIGQVWNAPMFAYDYYVEKDQYNKNAFLVSANPRMVSYREEETDEDTGRYDLEMKPYTYRFYVDRQDKIYEKEGYENPITKTKYKKIKKYRVIAGEWVGDSIDNHPDNVKVINIGKAYKTNNKPLQKHLDILDLLFK